MSNCVRVISYEETGKGLKLSSHALVRTPDMILHHVVFNKISSGVSAFLRKKSLDKKPTSICWFPKLHDQYQLTLEDQIRYSFNILEMQIDAKHRMLQAAADLRGSLMATLLDFPTDAEVVGVSTFAQLPDSNQKHYAVFRNGEKVKMYVDGKKVPGFAHVESEVKK